MSAFKDFDTKLIPHVSMIDRNVDSITRNMNSIVNNNHNSMQQVINQNITLNCPNVTNNSGIDYIQKELGHLSLRAMQEAYKR